MQLHSCVFAFFEFSNFTDVADLANFECTCDRGNESKAFRSCRGCSKSTSLTIYYATTNLRVETITWSPKPKQEERLLQVLRKHRKAIGWTLADLLRIHPSICMHRILLEEGSLTNEAAIEVTEPHYS
ncbi:hypothetical protein CR513_22142, partial [Mucuna pruriens]